MVPYLVYCAERLRYEATAADGRASRRSPSAPIEAHRRWRRQLRVRSPWRARPDLSVVHRLEPRTELTRNLPCEQSREVLQ